ncbi:MAG: Fe-S cluster assembly sulfur transfer protein SufU [Gemmatimonadales bacterium]
MNELDELYQQIIVEHNRSPRNFKRIEGATRTAEGDNPLCGDKITLYVKLDGDVISDIGFQGKGCAISRSSASLMTGAVKGKKVAEAERLFHEFRDMVAGDHPIADPKALGKLAAFAGVRQFPSRIKCANLAWHTLHAALAGAAESVTTE